MASRRLLGLPRTIATLGAAADGTPPGTRNVARLLGRPLSSSYTVIRSLDPTKLTPEDHLTTIPLARSGVLLCVSPHYDGHPRVALAYSEPGSQQDPRASSSRTLSGFLYYHQPACAPPLAGELRFRLTASNDPASFPFGNDFVTKRGLPWFIPLPGIAGSQKLAPIRHFLTSVEQTVAAQVMDLAQDHYLLFRTGDLAGSRYLHSFGQPFDLCFDKTTVTFVLVGKERSARAVVTDFTRFVIGVARHAVQHHPFSGTALCCFEPSTLPEHSGKRVVVVRVLRSLERDPLRPNPSYAGPPIPPELYPQEGQLLTVLRHRKPRIWARDVDEHWPKRARPLVTLFENAVEYGSPQCL
ncbi:hypothetical protein K466DRAFT_603239 [Polyporus arcularius HHB13444]|uniref:Uncharacterized protein n=1 Tax=Polyporus arcularius HHB13444 TaxID=1314778 RepID=A0A5C3P2Z7_9APHY|nr:hypothetical protein K466DRAFT_603239 [Polyporus arcularius HHB13444]